MTIPIKHLSINEYPNQCNCWKCNCIRKDQCLRIDCNCCTKIDELGCDYHIR